MSDTQTIVVRDDARTYDVIPIGRQGEKNHKVIIFDLSEMIDKYGSGTATLVVRRSQDLAPYVVTTSTDTELEWTVSDTDTLYEGNGSAEIRYEFESEGLSKSVTYQTVCKSSITGEITVPSVMQSWYDAMMGYIKSNGNAGAGLTGDVISALLACFEHVAWIDGEGQDYYDALEAALNDVYWKVANNLSHCTTNNATTSLVKGTSYHATITPSVGYTMEDATVSVVMGGTDITSTAYDDGVIDIDSVTGKLVITATAEAIPVTVESIEAVYTQTGTVYNTDSLDSLKDDLVVTATYSDTTSAVVPAADYTLSGTLTVGTSTITATCSGKTDTFTVTVTKVPELDSISAVYTQSGTVYSTDSLDSLKEDLVVTAIYDDESEVVLSSSDYTLSGSLTVGTSTITVTYEEETDTFSVTVTQPAQTYLYNWDLTQSLDDLVNGTTAEVSAGSGHNAPTRSSSGLVFNEATQMIYFGELGGFAGKTIEYDVSSASFAGNSSYHIRQLVVSNHKDGGSTTYSMSPFVFRSGQGWSTYGYSSGSGSTRSWGNIWSGLSGTSSSVVDCMSGKTVKIEIGSDKHTVKLYIDGTLIDTQTGNYFDDRCKFIMFGGQTYDQSKGDQCYNLTLTGLRIYENA